MAQNNIFRYVTVSGPILPVLDELKAIFGGHVIGKELQIDTTREEEIELVEKIRKAILNRYGKSYYDIWKVFSTMTNSRPKVIQLFVHQPNRYTDGGSRERAIIDVTYLCRDFRKPRSKKNILDMDFSIDLPGYWHEQNWNLHHEGSDYACKSLEEAIARGIYFEITKDVKTDLYPVYEILQVDQPWDWQNKQAENYHLAGAKSIYVDYMSYKHQWDEENRLLEERWRKEHQAHVI